MQTLTPTDDGYVFGVPDIYGVPLCVKVPTTLDGLWVVGKSAGYDPIAASSARVVPLGMAVGEAVGVAAAQAARQGVTARRLVNDDEAVANVRDQLERRDAYLPEIEARLPVGPYAHPHYDAYRLLLSHGLAVGGYDNDPRLDEPVQAISYLYLLSNVAKRFHGDPTMGQALLATFPEISGPLSPFLALELTRSAACEVGTCAPPCPAHDCRAEDAPVSFANDLISTASTMNRALTRGEMYELAARIATLRAEPERR